ncbi:hypothetical protein CR205_15990 [Alteribacter lacisalsi]|jgi:ABC-type polysaccharide/polyol phosphate export permease|uniref:ABC transmembrane type-2 domain-containing protein n=1 Tax=Alteribacter lacisalsi TaxID=2045244 RepID=A0A2W0H6Z9_9BACI|nr:ABC transporter permease [Alteribacter lacisalsi]PYZ95880.1 hypothetical protein CR205_15990 [Alteribacter lacisalsi]
MQTYVSFFKELRTFKDLIYYLIISDFKSQSSRTYLGILWWLLDPILYMAIFYLLVHIILERGGPDYAPFLFVGLIPLKWTMTCFVDATTAITGKAKILQQIYVPKTIFVFVRFIANTIKFLISTALMVLFLIFYGIDFTPYAGLFFVIVLIQGIMLLSAMFILAHLGVFFKDIKNMMQYVARMLLYLSPVLYSLDRIPEALVTYFYFNPLVSIIVSYRNVLMYGEPPMWGILLIILAISLLVNLVSLSVIRKNEKHYAKVI